MDWTIQHDAKLWPNKDLFHAITEYLLLKTGTPLSALGIANDVLKIFGIKTTYMTVQAYISKMAFVKCVEFKYVKPQARKGDVENGSALAFKKLYYLDCSAEELALIYDRLKIFFKSKGKSLPTKKILLGKIACYQRLSCVFGEVNAGTLVYYVREKDGVLEKKTFSVDFFVENETGKHLFLFADSTAWFKKEGFPPKDYLKNALGTVAKDVKTEISVIIFRDYPKEIIEEVAEALTDIRCQIEHYTSFKQEAERA